MVLAFFVAIPVLKKKNHAQRYGLPVGQYLIKFN